MAIEKKIFITDIQDCLPEMCYKIYYKKLQYDTDKVSDGSEADCQDGIYKILYCNIKAAEAFASLSKKYFEERYALFRRTEAILKNIIV